MDMMAGSDTATAETTTTTGETTTPGGKKRVRLKINKKPVPAKRAIIASSISFPYRDLDAALAVADAYIRAGGVALSSDQLAGVMGLQVGSGNFMVRVAAARMFGLMTYQNSKYEMTDLGFAALDNKDENRRRRALAAAFLNVPLYRRTYDEFKGKQLPPRPHGLEQAFVRFGVSLKQKEAARQIFDKSAQTAGFFAAGNDRLIEPIIPGGGGFAPPPPPTDDGGNGGGQPRQSSEPSGPDTASLPPFIQVLLDALPEPGTNWAVEGRAKWLTTASNLFDLIYKGTGQITVTAKPDDTQ